MRPLWFWRVFGETRGQTLGPAQHAGVGDRAAAGGTPQQVLGAALMALLWLARPLNAQAAALDHFSWGPLPGAAGAGQSFAVVVQARDISNNLIGAFSGPVMLTALVPGAAPGVLITEVETINTKRVELSNVSSNAVDVGGWRVVFYDGGSWPNPKMSFTIPAGTVCPGRGVFEVRGSGTYPGAYPAFYTGIGLGWGSISSYSQVAVLLLDRAGRTVDFFCAADAFPALIVAPVPVGAETWAGLPVPGNANSSFTYQRGGHCDGNTAADWSATTNTTGAFNPRLQSPFIGTPFTSALLPGTVTLANGVWAGQVAVNTPGTNVVLNADDGIGHTGQSSPLTVVGWPPLSLQVPHQAFKATPGLLGQGTVALPQPLATNLAVALSSSRTDLIAVPAGVIVPAGQTNASFAVTNLDDGLVEGPLAALVTATSPGFSAASDVVTNYDRPPVALSVVLPSSASETAGWVSTGQVQASAPVAANVTVWLSSSDTNRVRVPDFAMIPAGQSSGAFGFAPLDNARIDGSEYVTISASVPGWTTGQGQVRITDNESTAITVTVPFQVNEGSGVLTNAGKVQIGGLLLTNLVVTLTNGLPALLQVPATVIIPAGQTSAWFDVTAPDDSLTNGNQTTLFTASASGFASGARWVTIVDNDVAYFAFGGLPVAEAGGQPFLVTVYAENASGSAAPGYSGTISLAASNALGAVAVAPSHIGPFTNGIWSGSVTVAGENPAVVLTAGDGSGHSGVSSAFDVMGGPMLALSTSDVVYDPLRSLLWAGIQSGSNAPSIVSIDPASGTVSPPISLNSAPGKLAISDDGQFLYAALTTGGVARLNLNSRTVDLIFALPPGSNTSAIEMGVPPGDAHAVLVQMSGAAAGTALFRDGVLLTNMVGPAQYVSEYHFAFYDSRTNFFTIYPGGLRLNNLVSNGVVVVRELQDAPYSGSFVYAGGLFFGTGGAVYDPQNFRLLGAYPASGLVAADANAGQVFFVSGTSLQAWDLPTFIPTGQINLPIASGSAYKILRCSANVLAIATTTTNLLLVQTALVRQPASADLSVVRSADAGTATIGSNFTYSIIVSNAGTAAATNVTVIDVVPADATLVSASSPQGTWGCTNGLLHYSLGTLSNGAWVAVQFTVQPLTPGALVNSAWVTGDGLNPGNGSCRLTNIAVFGPVLPAVTRVWLNSDALVFDSSRGLLWVSTERYNGALDKSLHSVNVSSGLAGSAIPLGYPSSLLAMSADQNYLYAAYVNDQDNLNYTPDNYIRRANLLSNSIDQEFPVVDMWGQQHAAADIIGISSYPSEVVVARSGVQDDIALYQNGVAIARAATGTGAGKLAVNPDIPTRFYRLGSGYPGGNLAKLDISGGAINVLGSATLFALPSSPDNGLATDIRFANGLLFSDIGLVGDPEALTQVGAIAVAGPVETDPAAGLVFYLTANGSQWLLMAFDVHSLAPVWTSPVPGVTGTPARLIKCGSNLLAFRTDTDQLFILNTAQMSHVLAADLQLTATASTASTTTNVPVTFSSTVVNAGPAVATSVCLTNQFPPDALILGVTPSRGTYAVVSNKVVCYFGDLKTGASAGVEVLATLPYAGTLANFEVVAQATPDPIRTNNVAVLAVDFGTISVADLALAHLAPTPPAGPGSNWVYTMVVSNAGPNTASNVVYSDSVDSGPSLVSATASQGTVAVGGGSLTASLGTLSSGATATVTLVLGPCCGGVCINDSSVSSDALDPNPSNNRLLSAISISGDVFAEELPVPAADMVYDRLQPGILASLSGAIGNVSQSIVRYDLGTRRLLGTPVPIGNPLGRVTLSDDSRYLYVALTDTGGVARVDLPAGAVDLRFALNGPEPQFAPYLVEDMAVMPGAPATLAAARGGYAGYLSTVALFDSGVQRPDTLDNQNPNASYFRLQFAGPGNVYATSPYGFQTAQVAATGLTNASSLLSAYTGEFVADAGLVFLANGTTFNPLTGSTVATYPASGLVAPSTAEGRVYFLTAVNGLTLKCFSTANLGELWAVQFPPLDSPARLIRLDTNGVAFLTAANRMFWVHPAALATPTADLWLQAAFSPSPVSAGAPLTGTFTVYNYGPWTASGVTLSNPIPANTSFVSASSSQGACVLTNGALICALGSLTNGATATVTVVLTAPTSGTVTNFGTIALNELDPNPANNSATASASVVPQPAVTIRDTTVTQGTSTKASIAFTLNLSAASTVPVSVNYQTADGTAIGGQDYDPASGVVTIAAGSTSRQLSLAIIRTNASVQPMVSFFLSLTAVTNASLTRTQAVGSILKRVFETVSIAGTNVVCGSSGVTNAWFKLTLNQTSSVPVSVQYQTLEGSATAGVDFSPRSGALVFLPGTTNVTLAVPVYGTAAWQPTKTFYVLLSQPQQAVLGIDEALGTISNTNPVPPLAIIGRPVSQAAGPGATVSFTVNATGNPLPLSYQWQFNGTNITGATASSLSLTNVQPAQAGNYNVLIRNAGGGATNASAGLIVPAGLNYALQGHALILSWSGSYTLQLASNAMGAYFDIPGATNPYTNWIGSEPGRFFRLRAAVNGLLSARPSTNRQVEIDCAGVPGYAYVLQTSTDVHRWAPVETNAAPFVFLDSEAGHLPMRFYRAVLWQQ
jgi:uncharacterized repeat protein (TIGR01451 family)